MKVQFVSRDNGPERLVCEAELVFDDEYLPYYGEQIMNPLFGMKLVGFSLWKDAEGEVYGTFPSRAFGAGSERRYFDYLRQVDPTAGGNTVRGVKDWILREYRESLKPAPVVEAKVKGSLRALAAKAAVSK